MVTILLDLGDTIMDEATEIKDAGGTTQSAELLPGMADALRRLHAQGHRLALVADSRSQTPRNVLRQHGLLDLFECLAISEDLGVEKPGEGIFLHALNSLGVEPAGYPHVLMVGNNLERDIAGANRLGLRSVYVHTNDRRRTIAQDHAEIPRHTVATAGELLDLVEALSRVPDAERPPRYRGREEDLELAARFAPSIFFDEAEPFLPEVVGYTIFRREEQSPSFRRRITREWRPAWTTAIEYAIWWDWDIGHLYELEHVWSYLDGRDALVWTEASSHGSYASMVREDGVMPREDTHPVVFSQPGKHAFWPTPHLFEQYRDLVCAETLASAGKGGVLVKPEYARQIAKTPANDALAAAWLRDRAFSPSLRFTRRFRVDRDLLVPWPALDAWIPARVNGWLRRLGSR